MIKLLLSLQGKRLRRTILSMVYNFFKLQLIQIIRVQENDDEGNILKILRLKHLDRNANPAKVTVGLLPTYTKRNHGPYKLG